MSRSQNHLRAACLVLCLCPWISHTMDPEVKLREFPDTPCRQCPPGFGVTQLCNITGLEDTVCEMCDTRYYSDRWTANMSCSPCLNCDDGFYERNPCTPIQNVVCVKCPDPDDRTNGAAFGNEDYLRKCEKRKPLTKPPQPPPVATSTVSVPRQKPTTTVEDKGGKTTQGDNMLLGQQGTTVLTATVDDTTQEGNQ